MPHIYYDYARPGELWHQLTFWEPPTFFFSVIFKEFDAAAAIGMLSHNASFKMHNY